MTSQNLWSRYNRHFVGIARYNALTYEANVSCVIRIKLNQIVQENVHMVTDFNIVQDKFKCYHSDKHFSEFYLQNGGKNQLA